MKRLARWSGIVLMAVVLGLGAQWVLRHVVFGPSLPPGAETGASAEELGEGLEVVATDLDVPWELVFLPDGDLLVTERPGHLVRLGPDGTVRWRTQVPGVRAQGEGGLLGLVLVPGFADEGEVVIYLTAEGENRVERWRLDADGELSHRRVLLDGIPAASFHDGGRLAVGPEGLLWVTTGDAGEPGSAQDLSSLAGKVLRMTLEGDAAPGNPSGSRVFTSGHRNAQGLAWDTDGTAWVSEHGPSGVSSGHDEINRLEPGGNYGWPQVRGDETAPGTLPPALHSGEATWAPSGAVIHAGALWFGGLRGQALYELPWLELPGAALPGDEPGRTDQALAGALRVHLFEDLGRIRQVRAGPEGHLWILTGNRDGRGRPGEEDDRILRVDPELLRTAAGG